MIAKHIPMRSQGKSDFAGLATYITNAQSKTERLGVIRTSNCAADTVSAVIAEVLATQHLNTRAQGDRTYHLVVSFPAGEQLAAEVLRDIEDRLCAGLGFGEHQRISAVHVDTDHLHIHIAINKIHPERLTLHEPYLSYRTLGELCARLEQEHGLQRVNHTARRQLSENRAGDMERHAGIESLVTWIRRECLSQLRQADSWGALHETLREYGLTMRGRGNGLVIESTDGTRVKASTVARDLAKSKLEARLGNYRDGEATPPVSGDDRRARAELQQGGERLNRGEGRRPYAKRPLPARVDTSVLYARYQSESSRKTTSRAQALKAARTTKDQRIEGAKRAAKRQRTMIKLLSPGGVGKKLLYAQVHRALGKRIESIRAQYQDERRQLYEQFQRRTWADWLKQQALSGDTEALGVLRARSDRRGLQGDVVEAAGNTQPGPAATVDNITKRGTIIYRAGACAVRDDGERLQVSRQVTFEGMQQALSLALARYGQCLSVNGSAQFKAQVIRVAAASGLPITFADAGLEQRRQRLLSSMERTDERGQRESGTERGRADRRGAGGARPGATTGHASSRSEPGLNAGADGKRGRGPGGGGQREPWGERGARQPNPRRVGGEPPPANRNRLRTLSELGVVRFADRAEMLLQGDVPGHLEQRQAQPNPPVRRAGHAVGPTPAQLAAADDYVAEREGKRAKGIDIPKHRRYNAAGGAFAYAGTRRIDGCPLALLRRDDEVLVLPIDEATAQRLSRVKLGDPVAVTEARMVKVSRGRGR